MSNARSIEADASLIEAARRMRDENTDFILVTDNGRICGIVTSRDMVARVIAEGLNPEHTTARDACRAPLKRGRELGSSQRTLDDAMGGMLAA